MQIRTSRMSQTKGNAISVIRHCNRGASDSLRHSDKSFHLTASLSIVVLCTFIHKNSNCHTVHASTLRGSGTRWTLHTSRQRSTAGCSSCSGARTSQLPAIPSSLSTASALTTRFWKPAPTAYPQSPRSVQCASRTAVSCHSLIASETQRCAEALFKPVLARSIPQTRFDSAHARPSIESGGHNEVVSAHSLAQTRSDPYSPTFAQRDSHTAVSLASGTRVLPSPPGHRATVLPPCDGGPAGRPARFPQQPSPSQEPHGRSALTDATPPAQQPRSSRPQPRPDPQPVTLPAPRASRVGRTGAGSSPATAAVAAAPAARPTTRFPLTAGSRRHIRRVGRAPEGGLRAWAGPPPPIGGGGAARSVRVNSRFSLLSCAPFVPMLSPVRPRLISGDRA